MPCGRIQRIDDQGGKTQLSGIPDDLFAAGQGGMLDIVPHPGYDDNGWIYMTYSKGDAGGTVPALIRARLEGDALVDVEHLFESNTYTGPGRDYGTGGPFPDARTRDHPDMVNPVFEFLPTLAPSGMAIINGNFGAWDGDLPVGGLPAKRILRVVIEEREVIHIEELLLNEIGRIRDVRQGPDGDIYILNDQPEGALYRLEAN